jgi:hypothetical protein
VLEFSIMLLKRTDVSGSLLLAGCHLSFVLPLGAALSV